MKAGVNEESNLQEVLQAADLPEGIPLKGDKGYQSEKNASLLNKRKLKNHILKKAKRGKPLTDFEKKFNKRIGETRFKIERTFGSIKRWFSGGMARYRGIAKMHTQNLLEAIGYNLIGVRGYLRLIVKNRGKPINKSVGKIKKLKNKDYKSRSNFLQRSFIAD